MDIEHWDKKSGIFCIPNAENKVESSWVGQTNAQLENQGRNGA